MTTQVTSRPQPLISGGTAGFRDVCLTSENPNLFSVTDGRLGWEKKEKWHPLRRIWVKQWRTLGAGHVRGPAEKSSATSSDASSEGGSCLSLQRSFCLRARFP